MPKSLSFNIRGCTMDLAETNIPAIVKKSLGTRCFNVKVVPHVPVWRRHWEQLQPRYDTDEDNEPGDVVDNVY